MKLTSRIGQMVTACALLLTLVGCSHDNPAKELTGMPANTGFLLMTSKGAAGEHKYTVFVPRNFNAQQQYPAIVFLHGIGESGSDGWGCTTVGLGPEIARRNGVFDFVVIFPQTGMDWCSSDSEKIMLDAVSDAEKHFPNIDKDCITLTGMSSGGKGTWYLGAKHPEIFTALVPMGGFSSTESVTALASNKMPVWALHNDGDFIVSCGNTREMIQKLSDAGMHEPIVRSTIYQSGGHDCWDAAYGEGALFAWMKSHRRGMAPMNAPAVHAAAGAPAFAPQPVAAPAANSNGFVTPLPVNGN